MHRAADDRYRPGSTSFPCEVPPVLSRSRFISPLARPSLPPSLARSRLFLAHNPRRPVSVYVVHTVPRAERELLSGHSTPLPTVFLDYYRRSCAHNLCFPSTVRKRAVRQRRAHNDATTLPAKTLIV